MDIYSTKFNMDPYKWLFPLGTLIAIIAGGIWAFTGNQYYPSVFHSQAMIGSFLFSFVAGFLMTAVPRMANSFVARKLEVNAMLALIVLNFVLNIFGFNRLFFLVEILSFGLLFYFVAARVNLKKSMPPPFFIMIFYGLLSGVVGSALLGLEIWQAVGRNLFFNGIILFLVLGVGTRLVPGLRGVTAGTNGGAKKEMRELGLAGALIFVSLIGEALGYALLFGAINSIVCLAIAIRYWKLFSFVKPKGRLAYGIWASTYMVLIGLVLRTIFPDFAVQWMHLTYIGGFGMMTFTVASRVIISHGGYNMDFEKQSTTPLMVVLLLSISALIRISAPYFDYLQMLQWAGVFWIAALVLWSAVFIPRCLGMGPKK